MDKKLTATLLSLLLTFSLTACGGGNHAVNDAGSTIENSENSAQSEDGGQNTDNVSEPEMVRIDASEAAIAGTGYTVAGEQIDTAYDTSTGVIHYVGEGSTVSFTMPDGVNGSYDIYLELSKTAFPYGTTPFGVLINDRKAYDFPVRLTGCSVDFSDINELGVFSVENNVDLHSGDTITFQANSGFDMEWEGKMSSILPSVGDLILYPAGEKVPVGYGAGAVPKDVEGPADDVFTGKTIVWLGSSVTFGTAVAEGDYSMVDVVAEEHPGVTCLKYAVSGTTLADMSSSSYVSRIKAIDPQIIPDLVVVQLSTNDASQGAELGTISDGTDPAGFDAKTTIGAMETIIAYVREIWNCPIAFYTGVYYESAEYEAMVEVLMQLQEKWDFPVVDLWHNAEMTALYNTEEYKAYMKDSRHPNEIGYKEWWGPVFEETLTAILSNG